MAQLAIFLCGFRNTCHSCYVNLCHQKALAPSDFSVQSLPINLQINYLSLICRKVQMWLCILCVCTFVDAFTNSSTHCKFRFTNSFAKITPVLLTDQSISWPHSRTERKEKKRAADRPVSVPSVVPSPHPDVFPALWDPASSFSPPSPPSPSVFTEV